MKKNLLTILLTILIIVLLLFLGNLLRNFLILKGICNSNEEFKNSKQGYHFTSTSQDLISGNSKQDIYFYNGIYFSTLYVNGKYDNSRWYDSNTKKGISKSADLEKEYNFDETSELSNYIENASYNDATLISNMPSNNVIAELLKHYLFKPITTKDGNYIIKYGNSTWYINTKTKFITKYTPDKDTTFEYTIDFDNISESDVSKDNL